MTDSMGELNFMAETSTSSLYRNGEVMIRRNPTGDDTQSEGINTIKKAVNVIDARDMADGPDLDENGFELIQDKLVDIDFLDHGNVVTRYYPHCEALLRDKTGAKVFAFDHNIRSAGGKNSRAGIKGGQNVQGPAHMVHGDYTLRSAPERVMQLAEMPTGNDTLKAFIDQPLIPRELARQAIDSGRFAIINLWRNIDSVPVATHPLALCDGQTVVPDDLVVFEIHYSNRVGENYFSKPADRHKFYYWSGIRPDEVLFIKQWDSAGRLSRTGGTEADRTAEPCTFSFHTAFVEESQPDDAPDRWSIEVRCVVVY